MLRCSVVPDSLATMWNVPGFSAHGIFPARILERVAISSSRGSFWTHISYISCVVRQILYHYRHAGSLTSHQGKAKTGKKKPVGRPTQRLWASAPTCAAYLQDSYYPGETEKSQGTLSYWLHRLPGTCAQNRWNSRPKTPDTSSSRRKGEIWIP